MKIKNNGRSSNSGRQSPAFLTSCRGFEPQSSIQRTSRWSLSQQGRQADQVAGTLPKLTAELGLVMAGRDDIAVELLPGSPTTVAFTSGGKLLSLMVLPMDVERRASRTLGLQTISARDLAVEALYEEQREVLPPDEILSRAQCDALGS